MNYIKWKEKDSRNVKGLLISELPYITKPQMRAKETVIDGVDGSLIEELGYESYNKSIIIGLKIGANLDEIIEYFTGNGEVIFSNEPNKYYIAKIINGIDYARLLRYRVAQVTFRVQPFKYDNEEVERQSSADRTSMIIENIGNYTAKPIITMAGSGTVELILNGTKICQYTFPSGESSVILDSEKQDAYFLSADDLRNRTMVGDFPVFAKGNNTLSWTGDVQSIRISRYSRWV